MTSLSDASTPRLLLPPGTFRLLCLLRVWSLQWSCYARWSNVSVRSAFAWYAYDRRLQLVPSPRARLRTHRSSTLTRKMRATPSASILRLRPHPDAHRTHNLRKARPLPSAQLPISLPRHLDARQAPSLARSDNLGYSSGAGSSSSSSGGMVTENYGISLVSS